MAVSYGFYDSVDNDRTYNAEQFGTMFDGLLLDGIFPSYGNAFAVSAGGAGLEVTVGSGRAWFDHTWTLNNDVISLEIPAASPTLDRIDIVVIETNADTRVNTIKVVSGVASLLPIAPNPTRSGAVNQYVLAEVFVERAATSISYAAVTDKRGDANLCPFVRIVSDLEGRVVTSLNGERGDVTAEPPITVTGILEKNSNGDVVARATMSTIAGSGNTTLVTRQGLVNTYGRSTNVNAADGNLGTVMVRGIKCDQSNVIDGSTALTNGVLWFVYGG